MGVVLTSLINSAVATTQLASFRTVTDDVLGLDAMITNTYLICVY